MRGEHIAARLALVGNQNCGKTTLYNAVTGRNRRVGNFPGVTVDKESCEVILDGGVRCELIDLPGVYSLRPYSAEERVTREYLMRERPDGIINVIDATCPERGLYLTTYLLELGIPTVVALNMIDEVEEMGGEIDADGIGEALGAPVIKISASRGDGIEALLKKAVEHADTTSAVKSNRLVCAFARAEESVPYGVGGRTRASSLASPKRKTISAFDEIAREVKDVIYANAENAGTPPEYAASLAVEGDRDMLEALALDETRSDMVRSCVRRLEQATGLDAAEASASARYGFIDGICKKYVCCAQKKPSRVDGAVLDRFFAYPIFALVMGLVFWLTFDVIGGRLSGLTSNVCGRLSGMASRLMNDANVHPVLSGLVTDGIFTGVGAVLSFLPVIVTLFFFLSVLEDTGYMARAAFIMDAPLRRLGLSGKSVVPLLLGFGCSVPAVMAARTLPTERDRRVTVMLVPFMSCGAKIPIYALLASYFFNNRSSFVIGALYAGGIAIAVILASLWRRLVPGGDEAEYILELPAWRMPTAKNVLRLLRRRAGEFLSRAFGVILLASAAVWLLSSFDLRLQITYDAEVSILASVGRIIAPAFEPLGFGDWRAAAALVTGLSAKEAVIGTLAVLTGEGGIGCLFTPASALSFLSFTLLYTPCAAATAAIRGELGSFRMTVMTLGLGLIIAWTVSFAVYSAASCFPV